MIKNLRTLHLVTDRSDCIEGLSLQYTANIAALIYTHTPVNIRVIAVRLQRHRYNSELSGAKRRLGRAERRWRETQLVVSRNCFTILRDLHRKQLVTATTS